jgi:predicted oxidoreductase
MPHEVIAAPRHAHPLLVPRFDAVDHQLHVRIAHAQLLGQCLEFGQRMFTQVQHGDCRASSPACGAWRMGTCRCSSASPLIEAASRAGRDELSTTPTSTATTASKACSAKRCALQPALRERMEIVSKCGIKLVSPARPPHDPALRHQRRHIVASARNRCASCNTDRLDLLLIHRPDPLMNFDEIAEAFTRLQQAGKVRHFGVSNFTRHQFESLNRRIPLATNQVEFSPLHTAPMFDETFDGLQDLGVAPMIWSPLAGGRLFTRRCQDRRNLRAGDPGRSPTPGPARSPAWCSPGSCSCRAGRCR